MQEIVTTYLEKLNIPVSKTYCEKLMLSHPDCPSLLSISDTLQWLGVDHQAARHSTDQLVDVDTCNNSSAGTYIPANWMKQEEVQATLLFFINGYMLPRHYTFEDL